MLRQNLHYASKQLQRLSERRQDSVWLRQQLAQPTTKIAVLQGQCIACIGDETPLPMYLSATDLPENITPVFLGVLNGVAHFAVVLGINAAPVTNQPTMEWLQCNHRSLQFLGVRQLVTRLSHADSAMLAFASALSGWHNSNAYCGACGHPTMVTEGGHIRRCSNTGCAREWFPRIDPAVITLVIHDERCLLARRRNWAAHRYSTVAGFVEPGETLEHTVAREVLEEVAINVGDIEYRGSQPWPFPRSLMLGFRAFATSTRINVDGDEIEQAHWYNVDRIRTETAAGTLILPPPDSISRQLIDDWLDS